MRCLDILFGAVVLTFDFWKQYSKSQGTNHRKRKSSSEHGYIDYLAQKYL